MRELEDKAVRDKQAAIDQAIQEAPKEVQIPSYLTVREFAQALHLSLPLLMTELMKNGILSSVNERLDFDTAAIVAEDLGFSVKRSTEAASDKGTVAIEEKIKALQTVKGGEDETVIKNATDDLSKEIQKIGEAMMKNQPPQSEQKPDEEKK